MNRLLLVALAGLLAVTATPTQVTPAVAATTAIPVVTGLAAPAGFTVAADGRIFWTEKNTGLIGVWTPSTNAKTTFATIGNLCITEDQGLLGIALAPGSEDVFVYANRDLGTGCRMQVLRVAPGGATPAVIFDEPGSTPIHVGGRLALGPDGNLWLSIGDAENSANSQDTASQKGKLLRMTTAGAAAPGNPIAGNRMYAFGLRNVFGFDFDPDTGNVPWVTENGPACNDEVNRIVVNHNYGWGPNATGQSPYEPCTGTAPGNTNRDGDNIHQPEYGTVDADGPTGAAFCDRCGLDFDGRLLWGSVRSNEIEALTLNAARTDISGSQVAYSHNQGVLAIETGPDHAIYFSDFGAIYRLASDDTDVGTILNDG